MRTTIFVSLLALIGLSVMAQEVKVPIVTQISVTQQVLDLSSDLEGLDILAPVKLTPAQIKTILAEVQPAIAKIKELDTKREASLVELRDALVKAKAEALTGKAPSADLMKKLAAVQKAADLERLTAAAEASAAIWLKLSTTLDENQKKTIYDMTRIALKKMNVPNNIDWAQKQLGAYYTSEVLMVPRQVRLMLEMVTPQKTETTRQLNE